MILWLSLQLCHWVLGHSWDLTNHLLFSVHVGIGWRKQNALFMLVFFPLLFGSFVVGYCKAEC